jgi:hypothetical protein
MLRRSRGDLVVFAMIGFLSTCRSAVTNFLECFGYETFLQRSVHTMSSENKRPCSVLERDARYYDAGKGLCLRSGLILLRSRAARFSQDF